MLETEKEIGLGRNYFGTRDKFAAKMTKTLVEQG